MRVLYDDAVRTNSMLLRPCGSMMRVEYGYAMAFRRLGAAPPQEHGGSRVTSFPARVHASGAFHGQAGADTTDRGPLLEYKTCHNDVETSFLFDLPGNVRTCVDPVDCHLTHRAVQLEPGVHHTNLIASSPPFRPREMCQGRHERTACKANDSKASGVGCLV